MSKLKEGWKKIKLGEVAEEIRKSYEPNPNESLKYIGLGNIEQHSLKLSEIGESSSTQSTKRVFNSNDILFGSLRPYFRKVVKPRFSGVCSTDITVIKSKENCHQGFLFYFIASQDFIDFATNISSGTRMPRANWKVLSKSEWLFPPYETQRKIATILSAYDDLIENNGRRIQILEEMAQTIYKEWFVKFRFPGYENVKMVDSELGEIPEGWEVRKVKRIVKRLKAGTKYKQDNVAEVGSVPVIDQSRGSFLGFHNNKPDHIASPDSPIIIFGDHTCKMQLIVEPFSLGPNVVPFISKNDIPVIFLYFLVRNLVETKEYKRHWTELKNKRVVLVSNKLAMKFAAFATPMFAQIDYLIRKNLILRHTRDLLLPRLISGEIDVSDLDIEVDSEKMG